MVFIALIVLNTHAFIVSTSFSGVTTRRASSLFMNIVNSDQNRYKKSVNNLIKSSLVTASSVVAASVAASSIAAAKDKVIWSKINLPIKETLFDITFDSLKPEHGWLIGAKGTFLETFDGGDTWNTRSFTSLDEDEEINYRFEVTSLNSNEGWIIGKPAIMLHTKGYLFTYLFIYSLTHSHACL